MIKNEPPKSRTSFSPDFQSITLRLASPERIREWSYGEVTKAETINYRTGRSERGGLFDERIFGPEKDYECYCGKYRRIRYKDIVCERCGVEVTRSIVRRERMGHIELASPVAHIWFLRGVPSRLGLFLNLSVNDLEKVIYFAGYIVTRVNDEERGRMEIELSREYKTKVKNLRDERAQAKLKETYLAARRVLQSLAVGQVLDEMSYHRLSLKYGPVFETGIGAEAVYRLCAETDLEKLEAEITTALTKAAAGERTKMQKRLNLVKSLRRAGLRPEWMFLSALPVIPPDLRPMVALEGGRHATSDVNDLYRRVINRNNRLRKLIELNAPDVILRNEKRILQEAVDALIDNSMRRGSNTGPAANRRELKSLSDSLKGKQGRFRQNLLGKRVDYSGRSVIVVGPDLKLSECGLPKMMALELFRPFIIARLLADELAFNVRGAGRLIDDQVPEVWEILEEVTRDKYVLLNRAPTLHRLGIQAFRPVLIEGSAIQVHPLVCSAFNADFDGDQMAVHVPLSAAAQREARELIAADHNILKPGDGNPVVSLKMDIVLGCHWVTTLRDDALGAGEVFASIDDALLAHDFGAVDVRAPLRVRVDRNNPKYANLSADLATVSVGRLLFNQSLPSDYPFIDQAVAIKDLNGILNDLIARHGATEISFLLDRIKDFGFYWATRSGITWGVDDVIVPTQKTDIIEAAKRQIADLDEKYDDGFLSREERYRLRLKVWSAAKNEIERVLPETLDPHGSVTYMLKSGARGSLGQITQMAGMKGLIVNPAGRPIDFAIVPSYKEGLSPLEYFTTTHGSRKTLTDTALNTAKAGYLTQRLVSVAQEVVISADDCGEKKGRELTRRHLLDFDRNFANLLRGRVLAREVKNAAGQSLFRRGHLLTREEAQMIEEAGVEAVAVRSPLSCLQSRGVCRQCYGSDHGRGGLVALGEAVGIVAAQAIGEPGTQLTMRTKHTGGVDVGGDIVGGLPRVEELFDRRQPRNQATLAEVAGVVGQISTDGKTQTVTILSETTAADGTREFKYTIHQPRVLTVKTGEKVAKGQMLTDGPVNLPDLFRLAGREATENYIINEVSRIYALVGTAISRRHLELIVRQMFSRRRIKDAGDARFEVGELVEMIDLEEENEEVVARGGRPASGEVALLGISEVSLNSGSFLAAVSFQQATKVLIRTAVRGDVDRLRGLKENVIIGRLIPAGTGLRADYAALARPAEPEIPENHPSS